MTHVERITPIVKLSQVYVIILAKGTTTITGGPAAADTATNRTDKRNKGVKFKTPDVSGIVNTA